MLLFFWLWGCASSTKLTTESDDGSFLSDEDNDGYFSDEDCDDNDSQTFPGSVEICDGFDNNCDGLIDEGVLSSFFLDSDEDGFGDPDIQEEQCQAPEGYVIIGSDCDDGNPNSYPGASEICDGFDNDCDDVIDNDIGQTWYRDEDEDGIGAAAIQACEQQEGLVAVGGDCDDSNPEISPNAIEICDEQDNDCDGDIDEDVGNIYYGDVDGDGFGDPETQFLQCAPTEGTVENAEDCDDLDTNINPGSLEFCDYIDNNCDGLIDDSSAEDAQDFFIDSDEDGYGNPAQTQRSCFLEIGLSSNNLDCDDTLATISPIGVEICDGIDNNCDSHVDEDTAIDAQAWYADTDGDMFGNPTQMQQACVTPNGMVANNTDCDDDNGAIHPNAIEICDEQDNDCNGFIDSDDPGVTNEPTWFIDIDGDGFGATGFNLVSCSAPAGYVSNDQDCDNGDENIFPGALELCNTVDDDCDGTVDEADAQDALQWFLDNDGDGFGQAQISEIACDAPNSYVDNALDCDDSNADSNPDASEIYDLFDNDCDGSIDEDLWLGSGLDGDLTVTTPTDLSIYTQPTKHHPDAVSYVVSSMSTQSLTLIEDALGIEPGDEVLVINLQGTPSAHNNVGTYEFLRVDSVSGPNLGFSTAIIETYGNTSNADLSSQQIIVQRVPQYQDVVVSSSLTTAAFDGVEGGVLCFRATGIVDVSANGTITVDGLGYRGGKTGIIYNCDAFQGESYAGLGSGEGNGDCINSNQYNELTGQWAANYGGGGSHITGGGGNYGGGATGGASWNGGSATAPYPGQSYGVADLSLLFLGSGGGGVWNGSPGNPGPGGDGGGIIYIGALTINTNSAASISSQGNGTPHWAIGSWTYGAGGGSGGSVYLDALNLSLASGSVDVSGGLGFTNVIRHGGHGGVGRSVY